MTLASESGPRTVDLHVIAVEPLPSPALLCVELPAAERALRHVQRAAGEPTIAGVMLESFLVGGAQRLDPRPGHPRLTHGQSVTDVPVVEVTESVLESLAEAASPVGNHALQVGP